MKIRCMGCMEEYDSNYDVCPFCGTERQNFRRNAASGDHVHLKPETILNRRYQVGLAMEEDEFCITYIGVDLMSDDTVKVLVREYFPRTYCSRNDKDNAVTIKKKEYGDVFRRGLDRFIKDGRDQAGLRIPGLIRTWDVFNQNQTGYIVLEYQGDVTLEQLLKKKSRFSLEESLATMIPVMEALNQLHGSGMLHLNVHPGSILLLPGGEVKLMDTNRYASVLLDQDGKHAVKESEDYLAPELKIGSMKVTGSADVYSVCAILYRMLTGTSPDNGIDRMRRDAMPSPLEKGAAIDEDRNNAVMNGLNPNPASRTSSMHELLRQMVSIRPVDRVDNISLNPDAVRPPTRNEIASDKANKAIFAIIPVVVLVLIVGGIFAFSRLRSGEKAGQIADVKKEETVQGPEAGTEETSVAASGLVKSIIGSDYDEALEDLQKMGLTINRVNVVATEKAEEDNIIKTQNPGPGEKVNASGTVDVVVYGKPVSLKDYTGLDALDDFKGYPFTDEIRDDLEKNFNLQVEEEDGGYIPGYMMQAEYFEDYDADDSSGETISLTDEIPHYSKLRMVIGKAREDLETGEVISGMKAGSLSGESFEDALAMAKKKGFYVGYSGEETYTVPKDAVKGQVAKVVRSEETLDSEKSIKTGDQLLLTLSKGPKGVYKTKDELDDKFAYGASSFAKAKTALEGQNISVESERVYSSKYSEGTVISTSVESNTDKSGRDDEYKNYAVVWGDKVTLTVSRGPEPTTQRPRETQGSGGSSGGSSSGGGSKRKSTTASKKETGPGDLGTKQ
ncbi:MAG: PASTA domain-containing protein [Eubacterium sp.]|nr:PASTA domain-containing protein [Eubacterium sp.]